MKNNKIKMIIGCVVSILILVAVFYFLNVTQNKEITFKSEYDEIEFGTKVEYKDLIDTLEDEKATVTYPEGEIREVGTYNVVYKYKTGKEKEKEIEHSFKVVDTQAPEMTLYITDKTVKVSLNEEAYDPLANIKKIVNMSDEAIANRVNVTPKELNKVIEGLEEAKEKVDSQIVTEKLAEVNTPRNTILYSLEEKTSKKETYTVVKAIAIDENYNASEVLEWKFTKVEGGKLLNSGGKVSCDFVGEIPEETAYTTTIREEYIYNPLKLVEKYDLITTMTFKEEFDTEKNRDALSGAIAGKYETYKEEKGITVTINADIKQVVTTISVNFKEYDLEKDILNVLVKKDGSYVKMQSVLDSAENNKFVCSIR